MLSPKQTLPTAEAYVREFHSHSDGRTLHSYAGLLLRWKNNRYVETEEEALKCELQPWLHAAQRYIYNRRKDKMELVGFDSNPATIKAALESVRYFTYLPVTVASPSWLGDDSGWPEASEILACRSMLLYLPSMQKIEPTPNFITTSALDFDFNPDAPKPKSWFRFLHELFEDDIESQTN